MITNPQQYTIGTLFEQLGLDGGEASIERFIGEHGPIAPEVELADAPFWSDSQAAFLREAIERDAGWAIPVDELDAQLR